MTAAEFDLDLSSGRVRAQRFGPAGGPLVVCGHGLSANMHAFDYLAETITGGGRQVVSFDLRGRGRSETTPAGSYGLAAHARDVFEVADQLGADVFDYVGWSLGALIGLAAAGSDGGRRLRSLTLIDHCGTVDETAYAVVRAGLNRLDAVVDRPEDYLAAIKQAGHITAWNEYWDQVYRYELGERDGRYTPVTDRAAGTEDLDAAATGEVTANWSRLRMPTLLVRACVPFGGGLVISQDDLVEFRRAAPKARVIDVAVNHFGVMTDETVAAAVAELLARARSPV
jgi:pimeloyl-ACP methyl ester carboxylesterase